MSRVRATLSATVPPRPLLFAGTMDRFRRSTEAERGNSGENRSFGGVRVHGDAGADEPGPGVLAAIQVSMAKVRDDPAEGQTNVLKLSAGTMGCGRRPRWNRFSDGLRRVPRGKGLSEKRVRASVRPDRNRGGTSTVRHGCGLVDRGAGFELPSGQGRRRSTLEISISIRLTPEALARLVCETGRRRRSRSTLTSVSAVSWAPALLACRSLG